MPKTIAHRMLILSLLLLTSSLAARPSACRLDLGVCQWYDSCLETQVQCGSEGYPIGFGKHYCDRFGAQQFATSDGQLWLEDVRTCLQRALLPLANEQEDCDEVERVGFGSHPDCYLGESPHANPGAPSICFLAIKDLRTIVRTLEGKAWRNPQIQRQMASVASKCAARLGSRLITSILNPGGESASWDEHHQFWLEIEEKLRPIP